MRSAALPPLRCLLLGMALGCDAPAAHVLECPTGTTACPAGCADLQNDSGNCGTCGTACPAGSACVTGACAAPCPEGAVSCGTLGCVAQADCPSSPASGGTTSTASGGTPSDASGGTPSTASGGTTSATCAEGTLDCGNGCVNVVSCLPSSGECPAGTLACGIGCIDPMTNKDHCGNCNFKCAGAEQLCTDGRCHLPCAEGFLFCGGACVDTSTHVLHCGACNQSCPPMSQCSGSACTTGGAPHQLNGFFPTTLMLSDAYASYEKWKAAHVEDCGNGRTRVEFDTATQTVSEGIGYGMLLAAGWGDRGLFEGILAYRSAVLKSNKLLPWQLNGCSGSVLDQGSASDADLDVAMALLMADCVWPNQGYMDLAVTTINAIRQLVVKADGSRLFLLAGDSWGGDDCGNPSYYAPAYYRAFAKAVASNAADWTQLAQDTYYYLNKAANSSTGLVGEWQKADNLSCSKSSSGYSYNAARTPWRIVTDYAWWGESQAKTYATKVSNWANGIGIANVVDGYSLSGSKTGEYQNSVFTGALALTGIAVSQQRSDQSHADWLSALPLGSDNSYYKASLRALYMLLSVGRFVPGCY